MSKNTLPSAARDLLAVESLINKEDTRIIWLDAKIDDSNDSLRIQTLLLELSPASQFFTDPILCINLIKSTQDEYIILIVSGAFARQVLPQIHGLRPLSAVFIFCGNRSFHVELLDQFSKIVDIVTNQDSLLDSIRGTLKVVEKQCLTFSLFNQSQKSTRDLSKESASFLWHQLLIDVLKKMPRDARAKNDMLTKCTDFYAMNKRELAKIEEFRKFYTSDQSIVWYTDECFLYKLLNKAIRTGDIELLYSFRFFIIDLFTQLESEMKKMKKNDVLTLYRGQLIPNEEFTKLRESVGILISTNGFLSSSRDMNVALGFARQFNERSDMQPCLLKICADTSLSTVIFADIAEYSKVKDEKEVLFGLNTTFKIESVAMDETLGMWKVDLIATDEGTVHIREYMRLQDEKMRDISPTVYLGSLMLNELGQLNRAEQYYEMLLKTLPADHEDVPDVYDGIGNVWLKKGFSTRAQGEYYEKAYKIREQTLPTDHPKMAVSMLNMGLAYGERGDHGNALVYYRRALKIQQKNNTNPTENIAVTFESMGVTSRCQGEFTAALTSLNRALDIYTQILPAQHPAIARCLGRIGDIYEMKKDYNRALNYYHRQLEMEEQCLPPDHPVLWKHLYQIAQTYKKQKDEKKAIQFCKDKLALQRNVLGEIHPQIAATLMALGDIDKEKMLEYYKEAWSILENCTFPDELWLISCLQVLGALEIQADNCDIGITHWKHVLDIARRIHRPNDQRIADTLQCIGSAYFECMHNYDEALRYLTESLAVYRADHDPVKQLCKEVQEMILKVQASKKGGMKMKTRQMTRKNIYSFLA